MLYLAQLIRLLLVYQTDQRPVRFSNMQARPRRQLSNATELPSTKTQ